MSPEYLSVWLLAFRGAIFCNWSEVINEGHNGVPMRETMLKWWRLVATYSSFSWALRDNMLFLWPCEFGQTRWKVQLCWVWGRVNLSVRRSKGIRYKKPTPCADLLHMDRKNAGKDDRLSCSNFCLSFQYEKLYGIDTSRRLPDSVIIIGNLPLLHVAHA